MSELPESAADLPGVPDGFQRLWVPHRMAYLDANPSRGGEPAGCPFCDNPRRSDADGLIVARGEHCFVAMNLFPYNPGHLLVCPYEHVPEYLDLAGDALAEFTALTRQALRTVRAVSGCHGFNLGMNQGAIAGAGVAEHLHQHVVPRWAGDANFFPIVARTKAVPQLLEDTRAALAEAWGDHAEESAP
ncbi:HIT family protein [Kytococcus sedentarius]|uniref:HIT family protein n=1 Tax=Kytococcus sedentarius TaxID=1276 RepID=UPI00194F7126|nr:HIT domain-containing protein [Kytococcus sedentarius]QRO86458.1 HIT domain-containing protein [Kytococcus sedentarius]